MDEATKKAMSEFVQQALTTAKAGAQWTADQAPLLVQEWLHWQLTEAVVIAIGFWILLGVFVWMWRSTWPTREDVNNALDDHPGPLFAAIPIIACAVFGVSWLLTAAKVLVAPRVVVLEKLADLVK